MKEYTCNNRGKLKEMGLINKARKVFTGKSRGQTLIEVLIALAILGVVAVAFLTALTTSSRTIILADEKTTAESLSRTQLEYLKNQPYVTETAGEAIYNKTAEPPGYSINGLKKDGYDSYPVIDYAHVDEENIIGVAWDSDAGEVSGNYTGVQIVTVIIYHEGRDEPVLTTTTYKVNR